MFKNLIFKVIISSLLMLSFFQTTSFAQREVQKEITELSILEILELKQQQQLSSLEHIDSLLQKMTEQFDEEDLNSIFIHVARNGARARASYLDTAILDTATLDTASSNHTLPLNGIPIAISDNINVAGIDTTLGLGLLARHTPEHSAAIVSTLEDNGAIILAKTTTTPFMIEDYQNPIPNLLPNPVLNPVPNPVPNNPANAELLAGSSQASSATVIAAGLAPVAIATDSLGSARIAASLTGITAFKSSHGRYSMDGIATNSSTETPAILANSVKDIILVDSILSNTTPNYSPATLKNLKIGIAQDYFYYPVAQASEKVIGKFLTKLIVEGKIELIETEVNQLSSLMPALLDTIVDYDVSKEIANYLSKNNLSLADVLENLTNEKALHTLEKAEAISQERYESVLSNELAILSYEFNDFIGRTEVEAFILPTTPLAATKLEDNKQIRFSGEMRNPETIYGRNTQPGSFAGLASITLPIGLTADGLPVGIMLEGAVGDDARLLAIALAIEELIQTHFNVGR